MHAPSHATTEPAVSDVQDVFDAPCDPRSAFPRVAARYETLMRLPCALIDRAGAVIDGRLTCGMGAAEHPECPATLASAVLEAARWGEPSVQMCPHGLVIWAVPVMRNAILQGGIVGAAHDATAAGHTMPTLSPHDIRRAANELLRLVEEANLTNAALLEMRRMAALRESRRAEAIHELKDQHYQSIREIYLVEEPGLITAIKTGDRPTAREIINRILAGIYFLGQNRPLLLKSFLLELVVMMSRSAVEAGGDPSELLGANYSAFAELARIDSEEELCAWLVAILERTMDTIKAEHRYPISVLMGLAMQYMQEHLHEDLSRDDVARVACLSPTHFSRVVKATFGQSFTDLLAKLRVDRAREMLLLTEKSLVQITMDCGFSDQSYFTKVFQKITGRTPGEYRRLHRTSL